MKILMIHPHYPQITKEVNLNGKNIEMLEKMGWKRQDSIDAPAEILEFTNKKKEEAAKKNVESISNAATIIPVEIPKEKVQEPKIEVPGENDINTKSDDVKTDKQESLEKTTQLPIKKVAGRPPKSVKK